MVELHYFKPETLKALQNLKKHISNGCGGTNRNERLHEHIANYFNRSRPGDPLSICFIAYDYPCSQYINVN